MVVCGVALADSVGARGSARQAGSSLRFQGVSAESAADVWAVGSTQGENQEPAVAHWDGTALSQVPTNLGSGAPGDIVPGALHGVSADAPTDAWAVGNVSPPRTHMIQSLVLRWDGNRWSRVPSPNPSRLANDLQAVQANSPDDVWIEGEYLDQRTHGHPPFVIHWDGRGWSTVRLPARIAKEIQLSGFTSFDPIGPKSAFALRRHATRVGHGAIESDEVLHWNG
ncbi:MAG: hypothetical protein QOE28_3029, partial [Solirubrobacteraceae bacterium]|nr:hypothetical protein [Solirubrobacteraceae bacterium]